MEFATGYEGRFCKKGDVMPPGIAISKKALTLLFPGLTQGIPYNFQTRATGTLGNSEWGTIVVWIPRVDPNAGVVSEEKEEEKKEEEKGEKEADAEGEAPVKE